MYRALAVKVIPIESSLGNWVLRTVNTYLPLLGGDTQSGACVGTSHASCIGARTFLGTHHRGHSFTLTMDV